MESDRTSSIFVYLSIALLLLGTAFNAISLFSIGQERARTSLVIPQRPAVLKFEFATHYDISEDNEWATIFPPDYGKVSFKNKEYHLSMYLQLRCLDVVRSAFVSLRASELKLNTTVHEIDFAETEYCLDVLRQTILCIADSTLEHGKVVMIDGKADSAASGNHVEHVCRDWTQLREFVEDNQELNRSRRL